MKEKDSLKEAKTQLNDLLNEDLECEELDTVNHEHDKEEKILDSEHHADKDHYHGVHHFDRYGNHDDVKKQDFSLKNQFKTSKRSEIFRICVAAVILALSVGLSAIDGLLEKLTINIGGVTIDMRILDILVIILGIPLAGLWYSLGIAIIEPWFHFLIDGDHSPIQIAFDSVGYAIAVLAFFFIFYGLFRNSPVHEDPNKKKRIFKEWTPGAIIVPLLAVIFTTIFILSLYLTFKSGESHEHHHAETAHADHDHGEAVTQWDDFTNDKAAVIFGTFGLQLARFLVFYILFVVVQKKMKPINHRYQ
ncbi:ECF transporter S component [Mesoplasma lactucae]|uniref:ECF transporter S component n=1 Tax=Mesoplasma lactucae ATCC 49193 TaxID=81460 RepID=A0A291IRD2_9MOLU|nr:ECF transporter S component [Mesoplasma lactucae]ATG97286.1 ECF transporter S component [Mesoplasma lactucae ATCC 49193]ATZ20264.1 hypothetical protein MLACT_v1c04430 [Mesoplasma lactucae ATCC 49193]MCL8216435.1 hypothetical protein [Mesoplasma lactucae ATCC 49193]